MVLVDTSVWIEVFARPTRLDLESQVELDEIVVCLPVIQEVLQGFETTVPSASRATRCSRSQSWSLRLCRKSSKKR